MGFDAAPVARHCPPPFLVQTAIASIIPSIPIPLPFIYTAINLPALLSTIIVTLQIRDRGSRKLSIQSFFLPAPLVDHPPSVGGLGTWNLGAVENNRINFGASRSPRLHHWLRTSNSGRKPKRGCSATCRFFSFVRDAGAVTFPHHMEPGTQTLHCTTDIESPHPSAFMEGPHFSGLPATIVATRRSIERCISGGNTLPIESSAWPDCIQHYGKNKAPANLD